MLVYQKYFMKVTSAPLTNSDQFRHDTYLNEILQVFLKAVWFTYCGFTDMSFSTGSPTPWSNDGAQTEPYKIKSFKGSDRMQLNIHSRNHITGR